MECKKYPKVLVISHNCFSNTHNNGKTLSSFFKGWPKEKLAQMYFWGELPDYDVCENYYRVTDYEILDSFIRLRNVKGSEIVKSTLNENGEVNSNLVKRLSDNRGNHDGGKGIHKLIKGIFQRRMPLALIVRDVMWNSKLLKSKEVNNWINDFNPEVIFLQCSNGVFPYKASLDIATKFSIPIVIEFTDDYLTAKTFMSPFGWLHHFKLVNKVKEVITYSSCIFAIGDMMAEEYKKRFGGKYQVFMNSVEINDEEVLSRKSFGPFKLMYAGSLHTNRWKTLEIIGSVLSELNNEGYNIQFDIYTNIKPTSEQLKAITYDGVMEYKGSLTPLELKKEMRDYNALVHVEAFDKKSMHVTRLSVSTKIPECLASGISLLAVGPPGIASIEYLREIDAAFLIDRLDREIIRSELKRMILNENLRFEKVKKGNELANEKHNIIKNRNRVLEILSEVCK